LKIVTSFKKKSRSQTSPPKLTSGRIKFEHLRGAHSRISSQHH